MSVVKTHLGWALLSLLVLALAPALVKVPYFLHLGILALIWVIVAQGQNLVQGFTGYVSIAAAGFMGVGAYASTLLTTKLGWSVWTSMACAPLIAGLLAIMVGYPSLRVKGHYFAIVTMAYNLVIFIVLINYSSLTGGESGITGVPKPENFSVFGLLVNFETRNAYYYLTLICAVCATVICGLVLHSRVGRVLLAIRQNEPLVDAAGVFAWRYKMFAFVLSAALCGVAGALYAHFIGFLNPEPFGVDQSLNAILAVILGGSGTLAGPVVGAFLVVALPEFLRVAETYRLIVYGLLLVLTTIFMPRGIVPLLAYAWHLFTSLFKRR
ncbi:LivM ABC-type branched-chain amino acid transport system, permease component [Burkholderiaceae bacterium]|jgi:branched-chain amino acid transport system permease protein